MNTFPAALDAKIHAAELAVRAEHAVAVGSPVTRLSDAVIAQKLALAAAKVG